MRSSGSSSPSLESRGYSRDRARLIAGIGIACVGEALARWNQDPGAGILTEVLDAVEIEVRSLNPS